MNSKTPIFTLVAALALALVAEADLEEPCSANARFERQSSSTVINSGERYFFKYDGRRVGCADEDRQGAFMGYLNKTCDSSGPVLRAASDGNTWTNFTLTKAGKSTQGEDLVEIATYYPQSSKKPLKVHIQAKKGDVWALTPVKGKKDTYTIRAYSRKSRCLKYLAVSPICSEKHLQLDGKVDRSGRQYWILTPSKTPAVPPPPRKSSPPPPPKFVEIPAVNYSISLTGYTKESFGSSQQTAFCNSIYNSTAHPQDWMRCIVAFVTDVPYQGSTASGRKLMQASTVYVRGYTAFEFIYGNTTSQQQAQDAADGLYNSMASTSILQTMFQPSFNSSSIIPDAVNRGLVDVPENSLPTPGLAEEGLLRRLSLPLLPH